MVLRQTGLPQDRFAIHAATGCAQHRTLRVHRLRAESAVPCVTLSGSCLVQADSGPFIVAHSFTVAD